MSHSTRLVGFSALMKMFRHEPSVTLLSRSLDGTKEWTTRAPMLALTNPAPALALPAGTVLQPKVFLRNTSSKTYTAHVRFNWWSATASGKTAPVNLAIQPNATQAIDVAALQSQGLLPADANWASVILSAPIQPDELMPVAASYDASGRFGAQTAFSDQLASHWEAGQWQVDGTHDSLVTIANGGSKPANAQLTIFYNHGKDQYQLEQTLAPDSQILMDFGNLIRNQIPGKDGRNLPSDLTSGSYRVLDLSDKLLGGLYEGKVITDKTYGNAAYGCAICCGPQAAFMEYNPLPVPAPIFEDQQVESLDSCGGGIQNFTGDFPSWWTDNTSIATASRNQITGVSAGTTKHYAQGQPMYWGHAEYYQSCPITQPVPNANTNVVQVQITDADIENNDVDVTLTGPAGTTGTLVITANGSSNNPQVTANGGAAVGPGQYQVPLNRPAMPVDTYTSVTAKWNAGSNPASATFSLPRTWTVLGIFRHSQYNTPTESACTGSPQTAWVFNLSCKFTQVSLKSDFVLQTFTNGSGQSLGYGDLQYNNGHTCSGKYPNGATTQNSFLQVATITGSCGTPVIGGGSVATNPNPAIVGGLYVCQDNILLVTSQNVNQAIKHVADFCPACSGQFNGTLGHIDDYSSSASCSAHSVGDYGNFWTADTH